MRCDDVQSRLSRFTNGELSEAKMRAVRDHLAECAECRESLQFMRSVDAELEGDVPLPRGLEARVFADIGSVETRRGWLERIFGDTTMKKILVSSTVLGALVVGALFMAPRHASAETPLETFNAMRAGIFQAAMSGELSFKVTASEAGDVNVEGTLDGQPLPADFPLHVDVTREGKILDVTLSMDLSPKSFSSMKYVEKSDEELFEAVPDGHSPIGLEVTPKGDAAHKFVLTVDPLSKRLTKWTTLEKVGNDWKAGKSYNYTVKDKSVAPKAPQTSMRAKIRMYVGSTATVTVTSG